MVKDDWQRCSWLPSLLFSLATPAVLLIVLWTISPTLLALAVAAGWVVAVARLWAAETADHPDMTVARLTVAGLWVACISWFVVQSVMTGFGPQTWVAYLQDVFATGPSGVLFLGSVVAGGVATSGALVWAARHRRFRGHPTGQSPKM